MDEERKEEVVDELSEGEPSVRADASAVPGGDANIFGNDGGAGVDAEEREVNANLDSIEEEGDELKPRLPLIAGPIKGKGRRLVGQEDHPFVYALAPVPD